MCDENSVQVGAGFCWPQTEKDLGFVSKKLKWLKYHWKNIKRAGGIGNYDLKEQYEFKFKLELEKAPF